MKGLPDAIFVIDVGYENIAVSEAVKLRIPIELQIIFFIEFIQTVLPSIQFRFV